MADPKNEEWKKLFKEISRHITKNDTDKLCFYAKEYIPAGERETISNGFSLMVHFEDKELFGENNVVFLKKMLEYIGRKNLIREVEKYEHHMERTQKKMYDGTTSRVNRSPRPLSQEFNGKNMNLLNSHEKVSKSKSTSSIRHTGVLLSPSHFLRSAKQPEESQESVNNQQPNEERPNEQRPNKHQNPTEGVEGNENAPKRNSYTMTSNPRGKCIIINNMFEEPVVTDNRKQLSYRRGSDKDVVTLKRIFKWLKFDVQVYENVKQGFMKELLDSKAKDDCNEEQDCFVCCILSHGFEKGVYSSDGKECLLADLKTIFKGDQAPLLHGKPKLFFIQACQGDEGGMGASLQTDSPCMPSDNRANEENNEAHEAQPVPRPPPVDLSLSTEADFLFCMATTPGTVSYRNTSIGSWFIQELGEVLKMYAVETSLNEMLLELNDRIAKKGGISSDGLPAKMMSDFGQNTMRKTLYFKPDISYQRFFERNQDL